MRGIAGAAHTVRASLALLVALLLIPGEAVAFYQGSTNRPSGPSSHGFVLSLQNDRPQFDLGGPIVVAMELRNISGRNQKVLLNSLNSAYTFKIKDVVTGKVVGRIESSNWGSFSGSMPLPGWDLPARRSMYVAFRLDRLYRFTSAGTYTVQITSGHPIINGQLVPMQSNAINIVVK